MVRPYHSAGEYNFQRGGAVVLQLGRLVITAFGSYRRLTANTDIDSAAGEVITSINTSGIHVTEAERARKNNVGLSSFGAVCNFRLRTGSIGINAISYNYSLPLLKRDEAYNLYAIKGRRWENYSIDYAFTHRNTHYFGEFGIDRNGNRAWIGGAMSSISAVVDMALLVRSISPAYQSLYGNAFTENTMPVNENGCYVGVTVRPHRFWQLDLYADRFTFPWLKYRVDAPSAGYANFVQLTWRPSKKLEIYARYRARSKSLNGGKDVIPFPGERLQKNWRGHLSIRLSSSLEFRTRTEVCVYEDVVAGTVDHGFATFGELHWRPMGAWYGANFRALSYETDSYDARVYAYENDVPFTASIPAFYGKGWKVYFNVHVRPPLKLPGGWRASVSGRVSFNRGYLPDETVPVVGSSARMQVTLTRLNKRA